MLEAAHGGPDLNLFFMTSPYCRTLETTDAVMDAFENDQVRRPFGCRSPPRLLWLPLASLGAQRRATPSCSGGAWPLARCEGTQQTECW